MLRTIDNAQVSTSYDEHQGDFLIWDKGLDFNTEDYEPVDEYGCIEYDYEMPRWSWTQERELFSNASFFELFANGDSRPQGRLCLNGNRVELVEAAPWNNAYWLSAYLHSNQNKEYIGVGGHLFAIAVQERYNRGQNGELFFTSVDGLQQHYEEMLKATIVAAGDGREMVLPEEAAYNLWKIYFEDDEYVQ